MAKKKSDSVYRVVDVVGVSDKSWEDAGRRAVDTAAGSLRDLRVAEVTKMDMRVKDGKVTAFRTLRLELVGNDHVGSDDFRRCPPSRWLAMSLLRLCRA